jgi:hypothetical protein
MGRREARRGSDAASSAAANTGRRGAAPGGAAAAGPGGQVRSGEAVQHSPPFRPLTAACASPGGRGPSAAQAGQARDLRPRVERKNGEDLRAMSESERGAQGGERNERVRHAPRDGRSFLFIPPAGQPSPDPPPPASSWAGKTPATLPLHAHPQVRRERQRQRGRGAWLPLPSSAPPLPRVHAWGRRSRVSPLALPLDAHAFPPLPPGPTPSETLASPCWPCWRARARRQPVAPAPTPTRPLTPPCPPSCQPLPPWTRPL